MTDIIKIFNKALPNLKGGEIKAYWRILQSTLAKGKVNTIILNHEFMQYGSHLTKVRDVITATNNLKDKGLIFKVKDNESDHNNFRYSVNLDKARFGQGVSDLKVMKKHCKTCPFRPDSRGRWSNHRLADKVIKRTLFKASQICHGTEGENRKANHKCKGAFDYNFEIYNRLGMVSGDFEKR